MYILILLLALPVGLIYPIVQTIIYTYPAVKFYFSILYGPASVTPLVANFYVAVMVTIPFLYTIQIMQRGERDIVVFCVGLLTALFLLLLTATGMYYPILHRIYAPISILLAMLFLVGRSHDLFPGSGLLFMILPLASGILTGVTWQLLPNDLLFSIGQTLLFFFLHYELQVAYVFTPHRFSFSTMPRINASGGR